MRQRILACFLVLTLCSMTIAPVYADRCESREQRQERRDKNKIKNALRPALQIKTFAEFERRMPQLLHGQTATNPDVILLVNSARVIFGPYCGATKEVFKDNLAVFLGVIGKYAAYYYGMPGILGTFVGNFVGVVLGEVIHTLACNGELLKPVRMDRLLDTIKWD